GDELALGKLAARHLEVKLLDVELEEGREHRRIPPRADGAALVVAEAEVGREPAPPGERTDGAVENVDQARRVLAVRVAAHPGLVDRDLQAAGLDEGLELGRDD